MDQEESEDEVLVVVLGSLAAELLFLRFYLFTVKERGGGREKERERNMDVWGDTSIGCLSHAPNWRLSLRPGHVPQLGIEQETGWFKGQHSVHWTIPARTQWGTSTNFCRIVFNFKWFLNDLTGLHDKTVKMIKWVFQPLMWNSMSSFPFIYEEHFLHHTSCRIRSFCYSEYQSGGPGYLLSWNLKDYRFIVM